MIKPAVSMGVDRCLASRCRAKVVDPDLNEEWPSLFTSKDGQRVASMPPSHHFPLPSAK